MSFLKDMFLGFIIGIAAITPGLSGGALAIVMGLYEPLIRAINSLTRDFRRNARFLMPFAVGGALGVFAFSNVMEWLMQQAATQVKVLFLGLVAGSLPALIREANAKGFRVRYLFAAVAALAFVYFGATSSMWGESLAGGESFLHFVYYGVIYAAGSIIPGISSSFIFIHLGVYDELLGAIAGLQIPILVPVTLGLVLGTVVLIRFVEFFFRRYHSWAYYTVLGFLLGSAILIYPPQEPSWWLLRDVLIFSLGVILSLGLLKLSGKN